MCPTFVWLGKKLSLLSNLVFKFIVSLFVKKVFRISVGPILTGATLKAGMMERRNGGITERWKMTPNPKRWNRGMAERWKITPNPKRRNRGTAE